MEKKIQVTLHYYRNKNNCHIS